MFITNPNITFPIGSPTTAPIKANNNISLKISKDLKKKGFSFVGKTIIYSYLQAIGIYNDHEMNCDFNDINKKTI